MFVSQKNKIVFVAVPKTGTRSIYHILETQFNGFLYKEHAVTIPAKYKKFFSFCVARDPYDRVCSAYWSTCHRRRRKDKYGYIQQFKKRGLPNTLESFLGEIYIQKTQIEYPQMRFHENNRIDKILRFENIQEEFNILPFVKKHIELPIKNPTTTITPQTPVARPTTDEMLTPTTIQMINEFFTEDFELLGYKMRETK